MCEWLRADQMNLAFFMYMTKGGSINYVQEIYSQLIIKS